MTDKLPEDLSDLDVPEGVKRLIVGLGKYEDMALAAFEGRMDDIPVDHVVQLVRGSKEDTLTGGPYVRVGIIYDGIEVADVGLFWDDGWWIAGSGRSVL